MLEKNIRVGDRYYTYVSGERVEVEVVHARDRWSFGRDARKLGQEFQVRRVDTGAYLPKFRTARALHPVLKGAWPSMTEKQEGLGEGNQYRLQIWTGPAFVHKLAEKMRDAGLDVVAEGTEHVYVDSYGSDETAAAWNVTAALNQKHGTDFGLKPRVLHRRDGSAA